MVAGERFIRLPPSISAFSPSAAPLAEATRRLERSERSTSARDTLLAYRHSLAVAI